MSHNLTVCAASLDAFPHEQASGDVLYYRYLKYIVFNPKIMGGVPVVKGTRIPVEVILYRLKEGVSLAAIHKLYPWVDMRTLEGALDEAIQFIGSSSHGKEISQA